ncbi:hypothetical protein H0H93_006419 [Arthromyces matolae]|nr:hypothetical protein H0H93_006419 [Arthromyces matolae]
MNLIFALTPLAFVTSAVAHGFVSTVTIDGMVYNGSAPGLPKGNSIIRHVNTTFPIKGATNPSLPCGSGASPATNIANAQPGSNLTILWQDLNGSDPQIIPWIHNIGPMLTYMASCGNTTCDKFDATGAKWFKIDQQGHMNFTTWFQQNLQDGFPANVTVPASLAPGNYLLRHEIIALHVADKKGGAEFYPSCMQLKIGGNQTGAPADNELVSFPGAYSDSDPGIFDPDVFTFSVKYQFPGPKIAAFVTSSAANGTSASGTTSASSNETATSSSTIASSPTTVTVTTTLTLQSASATSMSSNTVVPVTVTKTVFQSSTSTTTSPASTTPTVLQDSPQSSTPTATSSCTRFLLKRRKVSSLSASTLPTSTTSAAVTPAASFVPRRRSRVFA